MIVSIHDTVKQKKFQFVLVLSQRDTIESQLNGMGWLQFLKKIKNS